MHHVDLTGDELVEARLPGLGETYLDSDFKPKVEKFITEAKKKGVDIKFNSAYRTPNKQNSLKNDKNAITPATNSLHSCGFAVDINFTSLTDQSGGLSGDQQRNIIKDAADVSGLKWGGNFSKPDPPHFYSDPGNRKKRIEDAYKDYVKLRGEK